MAARALWPRGAAYFVATPRLRLRPLEAADAPALHAALVRSREHLAPFIEIPGAGAPVDVVVELLRGARARFELGEELLYGVFSDDGETLLGTVRLSPRERGAIALGYWIDVDQIGQGYATEAVGALTRVAFTAGRATRVEIQCDPDNQRSARVAERLGFTHEATLRRRGWVGGRARDHMIWTLQDVDLADSPVAALEISAVDALGRNLMAEAASGPSAWTALIDAARAAGPIAAEAPTWFTVRRGDQAVAAELTEVDGQPWLVVRSPVCREEQIGLRDALAHNGLLALGSLCLHDGTFFLRHAAPLARTGWCDLAEALERLAFEAARLRAVVAPRAADLADVFAGY